MKRLILLLLLGTALGATHHRSALGATHHRSREVTRQFEREHPCPSTGRRTGACPGWIKDHRCALEIGGSDSVSNMQWQTVADAKAKDRWEGRRSDPRNAGCR